MILLGRMQTIHSKSNIYLFKHAFQVFGQINQRKTIVSLVKSRIKLFQFSKPSPSQNRLKWTLTDRIVKGTKYSLIVVTSLSAGLVSGSLLVKNFVKNSEDLNEQTRPVGLINEFVPKKIVNTIFRQFV